MSNDSTELIYSLQLLGEAEQLISGGPGNRCLALVSGREAFSTLFQYDIAVGSQSALNVDDFLGKTALFGVTTSALQTDKKYLLQVYGLITSVYATKQLSICKNSALPYWYCVTLQPPLAAACFSRNRRAYTADGLPQDNTEGLVKYVLRTTAERSQHPRMPMTSGWEALPTISTKRPSPEARRTILWMAATRGQVASMMWAERSRSAS